jgi:hypothetical protein
VNDSDPFAYALGTIVVIQHLAREVIVSSN